MIFKGVLYATCEGNGVFEMKYSEALFALQVKIHTI